jgi:2-polyprenyl-3-methyl-5-hydroxy-6-metoxy-1,4-benzoquinol methylase
LSSPKPYRNHQVNIEPMKRDPLSQTNAQLYDGYAVPMHSLETEQFMELLADETPGTVLDLGCADGQFAEADECGSGEGARRAHAGG